MSLVTSNKIALFTTVNSNYINYAIRCFQLFNEKNPGKFDFFLITEDNTSFYSDKLKDNSITVINMDLNDVFTPEDSWDYPSESFWYLKVPEILLEKGYKFSMCVDSDCVCLRELDFSWLGDDFALAGSPRMRNDLSEEVDAYYYLDVVLSIEKMKFLADTFDLINRDKIIDIHSGVLIFNNERWKEEGLYNLAVKLFSESREGGYPMIDDDSLLALLLLTSPKDFYKHIPISWNYYYEMPVYVDQGGGNAHILHMNYVKPWVIDENNINKNLIKGHEIWNNELK